MVSYVASVLSLFVPNLSFFSCFRRAVLRDCSMSWVSSQKGRFCLGRCIGYTCPKISYLKLLLIFRYTKPLYNTIVGVHSINRIS